MADLVHFVGKRWAQNVPANENAANYITPHDLHGATHRVFPTGSFLTMDFIPGRVNIEVDANNVILRAYREEGEEAVF